MENKFRNEMEIKLGGETILLRPTFENIAAMESFVGSVAWLGWKFSRGVRVGADGKAIKQNVITEEAIKAIPTLSDSAKIIYYNQAACRADDPTQKKFSLEEIWDLVLQEGTPVVKHITMYLAGVTAGSKAMVVAEDAEKKL